MCAGKGVKKVVTRLSGTVFKVALREFTCKGEDGDVVLVAQGFYMGFFGVALGSGFVIYMGNSKRDVVVQ